MDDVRTSRQRRRGRKENLKIRARLLQSVRVFFIERGFLEVETPVRIPAPAPEAHIDPVRSGQWCLHPSPELCMKRLVASGFEKIFQISRVFREGERGSNHLPEFTMLEWYRAGEDYCALMSDCEALLAHLGGELLDQPVLEYGGVSARLDGGTERVTVGEAFRRHAGRSLNEIIAENSFEEVLTEAVEPRLGHPLPTLLHDYPIELGSLARAKSSDPKLAERVELYVAGIELGNGFSELVDAHEQRKRFEAEIELKRARGVEWNPMPEKFLTDLPHMPECAGMALGLDRLAMLFTGAETIDEVSAFTPEEL